MQRANIMLSLAGDAGNTIPKFNVTPGEIAVLQAIHGPGSVYDVEPVESDEEDTTSNRDEVTRLREAYGTAKDGNLNSIFDKVFPGMNARVPESIGELNLPDEAFKPTSRANSAKPAKPIKGTTSGKSASTARRRDEDGIGDLPDSGVLG